MWSQFDEFTGSIEDIATAAQSATEDIRRATVYTQQQIAQAQQDIRNARPTDQQMPFWQRTWFYASDQEKLFIMLGLAGVLAAFWPQIKDAIK
jgi:hypothetical protein